MKKTFMLIVFLSSFAMISAAAGEIFDLEAKGYWIYKISQMRVINSSPDIEQRDQPLSKQKLGVGAYDLVASGTFTGDSDSCYHCYPLATIMRNFHVDNLGIAKTKMRGGLAILSDGSVVIARQNGHTQSEINSVFSSGELLVRDFMGGGALLFENGAMIDSNDLFVKQKFDQGGSGINSQQMRRTNHMLFASHGADVYLVVAINKNGKEIQEDFLDFAVDYLIKFDGGSGIFFRDRFNSQRSLNGTNSTGFGISIVKESI